VKTLEVKNRVTTSGVAANKPALSEVEWAVSRRPWAFQLFFAKEFEEANVKCLDATAFFPCLPTSSGIRGNFGDKRTPFRTKTTAIEQDSGAFFEPQIAAVTVTDHAPVHVRDDMIQRDIILAHQSGRQLRGAVDGDAKIVTPVYTHFDPDGRSVSRAFVICMLSSFVSREGLVNGMIVHSKVPGEKSSAVVTSS
jgi:hypothetical protein